ncbi:MAG: zinc ABC transporter substrate-binding protein, partial [Halovenus sp.]
GRFVDTAELDVAILAGHDSYSYVEQRYGFDLKTPTGISPDARASRDDIINLIETIEENEIDTILYDPFESSSPGDDFPQIVDSILEESSAEHAEPLTPVSGTTDQWEENGWGWIEQMEQVNMDSLDAALNPS